MAGRVRAVVRRVKLSKVSHALGAHPKKAPTHAPMARSAGAAEIRSKLARVTWKKIHSPQVLPHTHAASPPRAAHHSATPTARPAAWQSRASLVRHRTAPRSTCRARPAPCAAPPAEGAPHAAGRSQTRARSTRAVSISSLALHASMPDYFLVVAPPATRVETQSACDIKRPTGTCIAAGTHA